jgi:hypothetical protein
VYGCAGVLAVQLLGYWIFRSSNNEKNEFRLGRNPKSGVQRKVVGRVRVRKGDPEEVADGEHEAETVGGNVLIRARLQPAILTTMVRKSLDLSIDVKLVQVLKR